MGGRKTERGPGLCARCNTNHAGACKETIADEIETQLRRLADPNERVHVLIATLLEYAELTDDPDEAIRKLHGYIDAIWEEHTDDRAQRLAQRGIQKRALSS